MFPACSSFTPPFFLKTGQGDGKYEGFSFDCMFGVLVETIVKSFIDGIVLRTNVGAGLRNYD